MTAPAIPALHENCIQWGFACSYRAGVFSDLFSVTPFENEILSVPNRQALPLC